MSKVSSPWLKWPLAFRASHNDSRFSFCFYLPDDLERVRALLVLVHGSEREAMAARDAFIPFAKENNVALLAPLFPVSPLGDNNPDGYKFIVEGAIRYDLVLLGMIDEMSQEFGLDFSQFALFGFSGGAIFAQLFATLHARHLTACCFAAPGHVVLGDDRYPWPFGIQSVKDTGLVDELCDNPLMPVKLLIGSEDTEKLPIRVPNYGVTRMEKLAKLYAHYRERGFKVELETISGVGHDWKPMVLPACEFFKSEF